MTMELSNEPLLIMQMGRLLINEEMPEVEEMEYIPTAEEVLAWLAGNLKDFDARLEDLEKKVRHG